jgi:HEAT repeat protein
MAHAFDLTIKAWYEANQEDREIIVDTLFRLDCDRAAEFLDSVVVELDPWSRIKLIEQLLSIPTRRALDFITRLADDENDMVQDAAVSALKVAGYPSKSNPPSFGDK